MKGVTSVRRDCVQMRARAQVESDVWSSWIERFTTYSSNDCSIEKSCTQNLGLKKGLEISVLKCPCISCPKRSQNFGFLI